MNINLSDDQPDEAEDFQLFLCMLKPGPEYWRRINRYYSGLVRETPYNVRTKSVQVPWIVRCCMQPWLRKLLNPYSIFYN